MMQPKASAPAFGGSWASIDPPLLPWILDVIHKMGFEKMTPVQASTIPRAMKNQDCIVEAVTGSGKTLAFVIPVLERLCRRDRKYNQGEIAGVIVAPTRELAQQIHDVFRLFLSSLIPTTPVSSSPIASSSRSPSPSPPTADPPYPFPLLVTSGTPNPYETFQSLSSKIIIGTPGRLASFLLSPRGLSLVRCSELDVLVLDEADRLLSGPDHRRDIERILRHLPKQRRTHLFSATMTDAVEEMIGLGLRNPVRIVVNLKDKQTGEEAKEQRTPTGLRNMYLVCRHAEKTLQLVRLLQHEATKHLAAKLIVYCSTGAAVDYFYQVLSRLPALLKYHLTSLHGSLPPRIREKSLSAFTSHPSSHLSPAVLLCTDVAARGVDFADVDVVVQYDSPTDPKTFSHRAGRTARAGKTGRAVILLGKGREVDYVDFLAVRKIPLTRYPYLDRNLEGADDSVDTDPAALELQSYIRKIVLTDRDLADKGAKAFVSALHAYSKHEASFIFRLADLDLGSVAAAYGLLRLPAMPEVTAWRKRRDARVKAVAEGRLTEEADQVRWQDANIDWDTFAYTSRQRETARLAALTVKKEKDHSVDDEIRAKRKIRAEMRQAWSEQKEKKERKEDRRARKDKRKQADWEKAQAEGEEKLGLVAQFRLGKQKREAEGDEEMDAEYKALKREVKEERTAKKASKEDDEGRQKGMFGDLE